MSDNLHLSGGEDVALLSEDLHEVVGSELAASQVECDHGVGEGRTLIDGATVRDSVIGGMVA